MWDGIKPVIVWDGIKPVIVWDGIKLGLVPVLIKGWNQYLVWERIKPGLVCVIGLNKDFLLNIINPVE